MLLKIMYGLAVVTILLALALLFATDKIIKK